MKKKFPSDEFCNFHDGHGSVLDSQHYIHPCTTVLPTQLEFNAALLNSFSPSSSSLNKIGDNQKGHDHY